MIWFWPTVAVSGFVVLAALVTALATSSTARYEFERNGTRAPREEAAARADEVAVAGLTEQRLASRAEPDPTRGDGAAPERERRSVALRGAHPAGRRLGERGPLAAWWLLDDEADRVVGGPFPDRLEAEWAAVAGDLCAPVRVAYGVRRENGGVSRRQSPQFKAWLGELSQQLDRLADDWRELPSHEDELTTLVVEVAGALVEAGLTLHDCAGEGATGGVCLTPGTDGILVSWHQHERMSVHQVHGADCEQAVQRTMNAAVSELLTQLGFAVEPHGSAGCPMVRLPVG